MSFVIENEFYLIENKNFFVSKIEKKKVNVTGVFKNKKKFLWNFVSILWGRNKNIKFDWISY